MQIIYTILLISSFILPPCILLSLTSLIFKWSLTPFLSGQNENLQREVKRAMFVPSRKGRPLVLTTSQHVSVKTLLCFQLQRKGLIVHSCVLKKINAKKQNEFKFSLDVGSLKKNKLYVLGWSKGEELKKINNRCCNNVCSTIVSWASQGQQNMGLRCTNNNKSSLIG